MTDRMLLVYVSLLAVIAVGAVVLLSVTLVWLLDLFSEDPRSEWPSRQAGCLAVAPEPGPAWVRDLPASRTPWDLSPMLRAEVELAVICRVIDLIAVPQLRPSWVAETMRQLEASR